MFTVRLLPVFLFCIANEKVTLKMPVGEERKYSGYKKQIFVSGLLPSCKCPPLGASQCVCSSTSKKGPLNLKGNTEKNGGSVATMWSLSFTHGCPSLTTQKYQHLYLLSCCTEDKQKIQQAYGRCLNTADQMRWNYLTKQTIYCIIINS